MYTLYYFKDIMIPLAALIISIISIIIAIKSSYRSLKQQVLYDLVSEYGSTDMGKSIKIMWKFYREKCNSDRSKLIKEYIKLYDSKDLINGKTLDEHRRFVSQYYELFATYYFENLIKKKTAIKFWTYETLDIIDKILYPIESEAITQITGVNKISKKVDYMHRLYLEFKKKK